MAPANVSGRRGEVGRHSKGEGLMKELAKMFHIDRQGIKPARSLLVVVAMGIPLAVMEGIGLEKYWLSLAFGMLFVALSDPGGSYRRRFRSMAAVGLIGGALTALGFAIGGGPWGIVAVAAFVVTLAAGLSLKFGRHGFTAGLMLDSWFLVAISEPAGHHFTAATSGWWQQALAWLVGAALWIGLTVVVWLVRGRKSQDSHFPEVPIDTTSMALSPPVILFAVIQALAISISVAIAFGLHLPNADWMPIATLVAMKTSLNQATLAAEQRIAGAVIGALVAVLVLLTVTKTHVLQGIVLVLAAFAGSFRAANYALYCAAMAALVLIADDVTHPTNLSAEGRRVLFTFLGLGIGIAVLGIGGVISKRVAKKAAIQQLAAKKSGIQTSPKVV
jgi:Fusaric acid resistance protein-like